MRLCGVKSFRVFQLNKKNQEILGNKVGVLNSTENVTIFSKQLGLLQNLIEGLLKAGDGLALQGCLFFYKSYLHRMALQSSHAPSILKALLAIIPSIRRIGQEHQQSDKSPDDKPALSQPSNPLCHFVSWELYDLFNKLTHICKAAKVTYLSPILKSSDSVKPTDFLSRSSGDPFLLRLDAEKPL